jgi:thioredoxin-like negative regulator of GroEL
MENQQKNGLFWVFGGLAAVLFILFAVSDAPPGAFSAVSPKPVPGKVYELTEDSLAIARRHSPVLVALYTTEGNVAGSRMSRGLNSLANRMKGAAIVAVGNLDRDPGLAKKAGIEGLPAWVIYRDGVEISRAVGENSDIGADRLIAEATGK